MQEMTREAIHEIAQMTLRAQVIQPVSIPSGAGGCVAVINNELVDLYPFSPKRPDRKRVTVNLYSVESFIEYVNEHKSEHTRIFASLAEAPYTMTAAIDYHETTPTGQPEFITHLAVLTLRTTDEWNRWRGSDKKAFGQVEFAEFIEENSLDIVEPESAKMMETVLSLQAANDVRWKSAARLDNGAVHLEFHDDAKAMAGKDGSMEIPEMIKLNLAVFQIGRAHV